jgi:hypothetical protein
LDCEFFLVLYMFQIVANLSQRQLVKNLFNCVGCYFVRLVASFALSSAVLWGFIYWLSILVSELLVFCSGSCLQLQFVQDNYQLSLLSDLVHLILSFYGLLSTWPWVLYRVIRYETICFFFKLGIFLLYIFNAMPKVPHTHPPNPLPTHSPFLTLGFPCTGAYKVCKTNGPLFAVMAN